MEKCWRISQKGKTTATLIKIQERYKRNDNMQQAMPIMSLYNGWERGEKWKITQPMNCES